MEKLLGSIAWILGYMMIYMSSQIAYIELSRFLFQLKLVQSGSTSEIAAKLESFTDSQVKYAIIFAGIVSFGIYYFILRLRERDFFSYCKFNLISWDKSLASGFLGVSGLAISSIVLALISVLLDKSYLKHLESMESIIVGSGFAIFLSVGIIAPIIEEVIFRGLIFSQLEKDFNIGSVILIQALLFGVYHFNLTQGIYAGLLGIILGLSLHWTRSIWAPIIIHIVNNSLSLVLSWIPRGDNMERISGLILGFGILAFPGLLFYLYRHRKEIN